MSKSNKPAYVLPAGLTTPTDIGALGAVWGSVQGGTGELLWRYAHMMMGFSVANPSVKQDAIGEAMAKAVGRATPYSPTYVSRGCKAARAFPNAPTTPEEATRFSDAFYGHDTRAKGEEKPRTKEQVIGALASAVKRALKEGATPAEVMATVTKALNVQTGVAA